MDNVLGLDELHSSIAALQNALIAALPATVMEAAQVIEHEIQQRAPEHTGALERSIEVDQTAGATSATAVVQVDDSAQSGDEHYAIFQEFGTSKMAAKPFFRPGIESATDRSSQILIDGVSEVVDQYAD
jgi:HK97 gp10 family phage protein